MINSEYFKGMFGDEKMYDIFSDKARLNSWLKTEVALAKAQAKLGIIPKGVDQKIEKVAKVENLDLEEMIVKFDKVGFPILPFVNQLNKLCDSETARWVHYGATTQDILDTGTVLQIRNAISLIESQMSAIMDALAKLSKEHRDTVMPGRTFQQQAAPITFGYKSAIWLDELIRHKVRLQQLKDRILVGQCSGAVGTFATLDSQGLDVQELMFEFLNLKTPEISWHVARDRWAEIINWLAITGATFAKIASEVVVLMRSEIGELSEPFEVGRGASTTLPQKRNPIVCEPIIANAHKLRELVSSQLISMIQEHERGGLGQMHLEWMVIPEAFILFSGSLKHTRFILENLWVGKDQMRSNLNIGGGLIMSEAVMMGLAPKIGKAKAHHLVYSLVSEAIDSDLTFREVLLNNESVATFLTREEIEALLDPANYTGIASIMVDKVLIKYAQIHEQKMDNKT